jgi:hypothetical protein
MRQLGAEIAVGLVVCFAAAELMLAPARRDLRAAQASVASLIPTSAGTSGPSAEDIAKLQSDNASVRHEIESRSAASRDEAALFSEIMAIADRNRLRLEQFQHNAQAASTGERAAGAARDSVASYTISLSGSFPSVVRFMDDLRACSVFVSTRTVRIAPVDGNGSGIVRADVSADFFSFDTTAPTIDATSQEVRP